MNSSSLIESNKRYGWNSQISSNSVYKNLKAEELKEERVRGNSIRVALLKTTTKLNQIASIEKFCEEDAFSEHEGKIADQRSSSKPKKEPTTTTSNIRDEASPKSFFRNYMKPIG